jgi:hypothetical protein
VHACVIVMLRMHRIWKNSPALKHIAIAKDNRNFQGCVTCIVLKSKKRSAARKGDKVAWTEADTELTYGMHALPCAAMSTCPAQRALLNTSSLSSAACSASDAVCTVQCVSMHSTAQCRCSLIDD